LIDFGLDEIKDDGEEYIIYSNFTDFGTMQKHLEGMGIEIDEISLERIPNMTKKLEDDQVDAIFKLIDRLEEDDDVSQVFHTMDMSE
jgi:transcriptional/translational regulatory protein YebC/TACO1